MTAKQHVLEQSGKVDLVNYPMNTPLEQAQSHLLYWVKFTCEEVGAFYDAHEDLEPPSWLAELRAAATEVEDEGGEAIEP